MAVFKDTDGGDSDGDFYSDSEDDEGKKKPLKELNIGDIVVFFEGGQESCVTLHGPESHLYRVKNLPTVHIAMDVWRRSASIGILPISHMIRT